MTGSTEKHGLVSAVNCRKLLSQYAGQEHRIIGVLEYDPFREGTLQVSHPVQSQELVPFPFSEEQWTQPRPFLPQFPSSAIGSLVTVRVSGKHWRNVSLTPRYQNNEIWGTDVYTDDSDPLLAMRHCGLDIDNVHNNEHELMRTPGNLHNPDNVQAPEDLPQDFYIDVTLILLPPLQRYYSLQRHGIASRQWGIVGSPFLDHHMLNNPQLEQTMDLGTWNSAQNLMFPNSNTRAAIHDGLSYAIYNIVVKPSVVDSQW